jgi:hypothetical protein
LLVQVYYYKIICSGLEQEWFRVGTTPNETSPKQEYRAQVQMVPFLLAR